MRRIARTSCPRPLLEKGAEWTARWAERVGEDRACGFDWPRYGNQRLNHLLEEPLGEMTRGHCAFCDGSFSESQRTIEHFRPKRSFPDKAFEWDNLFPACTRCQGAKLETWDERLLKPDDADYAFDDYFICDAGSGEILPNPAASEANRARARITIDSYGLRLKERCIARRREWLGFLSRRRAGDDVMLDDFDYRFFIEACSG